MVGADGTDSNRTDETLDAPETPETTEATAAEESADGDGEIIRSPSQEHVALTEDDLEAEVAEETAAAEPETDWEAQYDKARNQLLRVAADFENYKKRAKRDLSEAAFRARDEVLQELLPVIDNLERAISHADTSAECVDADTLLEGVRMVLRQFEGSMDRFGVKGFDSVGQAFDPNFHEALQQRETDEVPAGHVVEEYRKGYMMGERLVRPAMVVVAMAPADAGKDATDAGSEEAADESAEAPAEGSAEEAGSGEERSGE